MHRSHPAGRTLHVIDIENLVGGSGAGAATVAPVLSAYRSTVAVGADRDSLAGDLARLAMHRTLSLAS
jgi:hypothetical protein